ncbi:hypothetical protein AKJ51_02800 [candidate division MSBL1 archaeon SCGC-AAA382A20]|uniref:Helicase ATP-binding domain-containing protein n=1 Tax=candidate division MSBL1 archaeon SCGC-AAA382A20 TaxID=1698280 RepID=A0A133VK57_9EURY|nr:hypothetical protein AKJ51_02800 [candidate division MSBL1 archaeon SCGC-AAA382A20]
MHFPPSVVSAENSDGLVLFLAPSKPLVEQHAETLGEHLDADVEVVTGETHGPDERSEAWKVGRVAAATPQTVWNDVRVGRLGLGDCPLIVFDEAHRATGNYAYDPICRHYLDTCGRPSGRGMLFAE